MLKPIAALVCLAPLTLAAQDTTRTASPTVPARWDVSAAHGPTSVVEFETSEGTWMNLDVSPDGKQIVFDLLGDLYLLPIDGGKARRLTSGRAFDVQPRFSPDGTQIAFTSDRSGGNNLWRIGVDGKNPVQVSKEDFRLLNNPVWTPDGRRVAFLATRNNRRTAWMQRADGSDSVQPASPQNIPLDEIWFDPLGRYTVFRSQGGAAGTRRLTIMRTGVDTVARPLLQSRFDTFAMVVSPDGQWLAYVSNESGSPEVYVRPFPNVDSARVAISVGGGVEPLWKRDGTELFFRNPRGDMFAVPVTLGRRFSAGAPKLLFSVPGLSVQDYHRSYDVHPDGKRFLMLASGGSDATELNLILNWRAELERLEKAAQ